MKKRLWGVLALCLLMWPLGGINAQDGVQGWPIELTVGEATLDLSAQEIGELFKSLLEKAGS